MYRQLLRLLIVVFCFNGLAMAQNNFSLLKNNNPSKLARGSNTGFILSGSDTTEECNITLTEGFLLKNVRVLDPSDSSLTITKSMIDKSYPISHLDKIAFENHGFWKGFSYGLLGSVVLCGTVGLLTINGDAKLAGFLIGFAMGIPTGMITGMISEFSSKNDVYDFRNINPDTKIKRLQYIIRKHIQ
jgi:hypothetical protein